VVLHLEGLSLFDGYRFTNYGVDEGLPRPYVNDILEAQGGQYWVATNVGLYKFDPKGRPGRATSAPGARAQPAAGAMFTLVAPTPDDQPLNITTILRGRDGAIWCGTATGLWRLSDAAPSVELRAAKTEPPSPLPGTVNALVEDRGGTLWIGAANGLYRRWPDGTTERYGSSNGLPDETIHDVLEDRTGSLWIGTRAGGLARLAIEAGPAPPVVTHIYSPANGLAHIAVVFCTSSSNRHLWA
jgi:ligand-binding sensor domain-containing protein